MTKSAAPAEEKRKHVRFHEVFFGNADVCLLPVPPLYGDAARGCLVDLSAGGMALLLTEALPKKVFLKMTLRLPDGFVIESVVTVCRIVSCGTAGFLHGIEFLNPSPESMEKIDAMARDSVACNGRICAGAAEVCQSTCSLLNICKKQECRTRAKETVQVSFQDAPPSTWESFKEKFKDNLKAA
jgi:hypothetical protein